MSAEGCVFESRSRQQSALWGKVEFSFRAMPYILIFYYNLHGTNVWFYFPELLCACYVEIPSQWKMCSVPSSVISHVSYPEIVASLLKRFWVTISEKLKSSCLHITGTYKNTCIWHKINPKGHTKTTLIRFWSFLTT